MQHSPYDLERGEFRKVYPRGTNLADIPPGARGIPSDFDPRPVERDYAPEPNTWLSLNIQAQTNQALARMKRPNTSPVAAKTARDGYGMKGVGGCSPFMGVIPDWWKRHTAQCRAITGQASPETKPDGV